MILVADAETAVLQVTPEVSGTNVCTGDFAPQVRKNSLNIKFLGRIFVGHPGPRRRDIPDKNFMQVAFFCCFRQGVAGMSRDLGRDVPDLEKLYARKLWADFSYPSVAPPERELGAELGNKFWTPQQRKKEAHKHKIVLPGDRPVGEESTGRVSRGQRFVCYLRNPRIINPFVQVPDREDQWPRWLDRVLCAKVLCTFSAP